MDPGVAKYNGNKLLIRAVDLFYLHKLIIP